MITIKNTQKNIKINNTLIRKLIKKILQEIGYPDFDIGLWFTTNKTIQKYNKNYRGIDKPTDILSFPYHATITPEKILNARTPEDKNLGDLIISAEFVKKGALELHKNFTEHLDTILIHGICHLIGHTHEHDRDYQKMARLEKTLLRLINDQ